MTDYNITLDEIDPTGTTDVTAVLNYVFAVCADHSTITFPATAVYRIDGTVVMNGKIDLTINASGVKLLAGTDGREAKDPRTRRHLLIENCLQIKVSGLEIQGANPNGGTDEDAYVVTLEAQHCIDVESCAAVELVGLDLHDPYGDFVYVRGSAYVWIHNNVMARNGRQGVSVTRGSLITIQGNSISGVRHAVFDLEPNTLPEAVEHVVIAENCVGAHRLTFVSSLGQGPVNNITIRGNMITASQGMNIIAAAPVGQRRHDWTIWDNVANIVRSGDSLMRFLRMDNVVVVNNTQPCNPRVLTPVYFEDCTSTVDSGNNWAMP